MIGDLAAAVASIRAAAATGRINIEANLPGIRDAAARAPYSEVAAGVDGVLARADALTADVRTDLALLLQPER